LRGNSEKKALKANAPAHWAPSIRKNFLRLRKRIVQTWGISWPSLPGLRRDTAGDGGVLLALIIELCMGDGSVMLVLRQKNMLSQST